MFQNPENIIPIQKDDFLVNLYNTGKTPCKAFVRVYGIDPNRNIVTLLSCDDSEGNLTHICITEAPFLPPLVRGTVAFPSQHTNGTYRRIEEKEVPEKIRTRLKESNVV